MSRRRWTDLSIASGVDYMRERQRERDCERPDSGPECFPYWCAWGYRVTAHGEEWTYYTGGYWNSSDGTKREHYEHLSEADDFARRYVGAP